MESPAPPAACWLCAAPLPPGADRCPECALHQARELPEAARWRMAVGLVVIYAVSAVLLALTT